MVGRVRKYTTPARTTARCARLFATRIVLGLRRPRGFHRRVELGINSALKTDAPDTVPPIVLLAVRLPLRKLSAFSRNLSEMSRRAQTSIDRLRDTRTLCRFPDPTAGRSRISDRGGPRAGGGGVSFFAPR